MNLQDDYSPLDLLRRPLTIFNHEVSRMRWKPELSDLRKADSARVRTVFRGIILMIILTVMAISLDRPTRWYIGSVAVGITAGTIFLVPWLVGVMADLFTASSVVTFWHARAREETLDLLRLTMTDDVDLLNSMRAIAELVAWRGMRWETALRAFLSMCMFVACAGVGLAVVVNLFMARDTPDVIASVFSLCVIVWLVRLFIMYVREPLWRIRALVAVSIAVASHVQDTNTAILIVSGAALFLKLVQVTVAVSLIIGTVTLIFSYDRSDKQLASAVWLIAGSVLVPLLVCLAYLAVHTWCTRLTLRMLQGTME